MCSTAGAPPAGPGVRCLVAVTYAANRMSVMLHGQGGSSGSAPIPGTGRDVPGDGGTVEGRCG
ncbi:hypothetical protein ACIGXI_32195 [Kitasatospora aureofaciens]|uniref:hypothetical protein n=1 Tax=Kitasatospora aureofaciens TaxID=1894 RepID=UPI0037C51ABB